MNVKRGRENRGMSSIDDVIRFFEKEIKQTESDIDEMSNCFNGVKVGIKQSYDLRRKHIRYCQNIIDRIRSDSI